MTRIVRETELSILACQEHFPDLHLARLVLMTESDSRIGRSIGP